MTEQAGTPTSLEAQGEIRGEVLTPRDLGYDDARAVFNATADRRPSLIVRCRGVADVKRSIEHARSHDLLLAVRCGGHSFSGKSVCDDGLVIDLSPMRGVRVDPERRTVRVEGGATWRDVDHETQAFGLATPGGVISHTGVGGLTLGGGIGWLSRKHGLSIDNLISADMVTADGRLVHACEDENPDLFWGLRGGGGNFGVVTSFEFRVHPVGPEVLGGFAVHRMDAAAEGLRLYREFMAEAPDELCCYPIFGTLPSEPFIPEAYHGKTALFIAVCYAGPVAEGEAAIHPLRDFSEPILDTIQPTPYTVLQQAFDEAQKHGNRWYGKSAFWDDIPNDAIDTVVERIDPLSGPLTMVFFESMGGAIGRVDANATAFPHRGLPYNFGITAGWIEPEEDEEHITWARELFGSLSEYGSGVYVNYADEDTDPAATAFGSNYERLREVKEAWDPDNVFRMNMNITPR